MRDVKWIEKKLPRIQKRTVRFSLEDSLQSWWKMLALEREREVDLVDRETYVVDWHSRLREWPVQRYVGMKEHWTLRT